MVILLTLNGNRTHRTNRFTTDTSDGIHNRNGNNSRLAHCFLKNKFLVLSGSNGNVNDRDSALDPGAISENFSRRRREKKNQSVYRPAVLSEDDDDDAKYLAKHGTEKIPTTTTTTRRGYHDRGIRRKRTCKNDDKYRRTRARGVADWRGLGEKSHYGGGRPARILDPLGFTAIGGGGHLPPGFATSTPPRRRSPRARSVLGVLAPRQGYPPPPQAPEKRFRLSSF